jgi:hypothetical protein
MIHFKELSKAQRNALLNFMAVLPASSERHQHDGVVVELGCNEAVLNAILDADVSAVSLSADEPEFVERHTVPDDHRSLMWLHRLIDDIYAHRWHMWTIDDNVDTPLVDDLSVHVFQFLSKRFGIDNLVRSNGSALLQAVKVHRQYDLTSQIFGVLMSSASYDSVDVRAFLEWRVVLAAYATQRVPTNPTRFVEVRHIPALLRKCVKGSSLRLRHMIRNALARWFDVAGCFPAVVPDPAFYCPPFLASNPYLGKEEVPAADAESPFLFHGADGRVVDVQQLLVLLLLNFKQERMTAARSDSLTRTSPARNWSSILSPTSSSSAKRSKRPQASLPWSASKIADVEIPLKDYAALHRWTDSEEAKAEPSSALKYVRSMSSFTPPARTLAQESPVELPGANSGEQADVGDIDALELRLARVVNSFVRNRSR